MLASAECTPLSSAAMSDDSAYSKDRPFLARVTESRLLNKPGSAKETRHFEVSLAGSGLSYKAGDSLGVFAENRKVGDEPVSPVMLKLPAPIPLREALTSRLALKSPTRKVIETLAERATSAEEKSRLSSLLVPEAKDVLGAFLYEREFVDLLAEFPSARLTPQELVDHMRKLMPRLYSIASSPRAHPQVVHLTIAVVRYVTNHRERVGACSTYLADRVAMGQPTVPVFVSHSHFGPPDDGAKDVIMVGHGHRAVPGLRAGSDRQRGDRTQLAVFRRSASGDGLSLRGGLVRVARRRPPGAGRHRIFPRPAPQGLRAGPHARKCRRAVVVAQGRGLFLRLR